MKYWLTTDTHFSHKMLIEKGLRPNDFENKILKGFTNIKETDILIHLGDIGLGNDKKVASIFGKIKCKRKILCKGNHDHKSTNWYLDNGWDWVCHNFQARYFGKIILFSHIPMRDNGSYDLNIHGHFHDTEAGRYEAELKAILNDKQILLALEKNNYQLWDLEKLLTQK